MICGHLRPQVKMVRFPPFDESGAAPDPFEDDEVCKLVFFCIIHVYAISKMYFMHTLHHRSPLSG